MPVFQTTAEALDCLVAAGNDRAEMQASIERRRALTTWSAPWSDVVEITEPVATGAARPRVCHGMNADSGTQLIVIMADRA